MLAMRLFLILIAAVMVFSLLGYAISHDPRWLRFAGLGLKAGLALVALLMLVFLIERLLLVV
jgi:hypothetical protein